MFQITGVYADPRGRERVFCMRVMAVMGGEGSERKTLGQKWGPLQKESLRPHPE